MKLLHDAGKLARKIPVKYRGIAYRVATAVAAGAVALEYITDKEANVVLTVLAAVLGLASVNTPRKP